ncbi:hypothetical protein MLD38_022029 [Melastoma candidum]|uniref:Uncharacterized protein n=1 Tax=Melastoma candidum TaxID=119954 RepID=A0ACB9QLT8_9MYRT|nr:hypothetical protein MLD38_022029 [Melastoma candidum]
MDLLRRAYDGHSSDEEREAVGADLSPAKRHKPQFPKPYYTRSAEVRMPTQAAAPIEGFVPGRYVSKRERAMVFSGAANVPSPSPIGEPQASSPSPSSAVMGSLSDSSLPSEIISSLRNQSASRSRRRPPPYQLSVALTGHERAVTAIRWSKTHSHLLASAGMDGKVYIWNVWSKDQNASRILTFHNSAVKDVKWSEIRWSILSCGYDCTSRLANVEKGTLTQVFREDQVVNTVSFSPEDSNIFLSGGTNGSLRLWDVRTGKMVHSYIRKLGPILDLEFSLDGKRFISSSDVSRSNISENSLVVWDVRREVPLSSQVYAEAYTCPCVRHHPTEPNFVAQSNGNYVALFSSVPPFRLDKYKRYEGHGVSGFPIKCDFSLDGEILASGSSEGSLYFYDYRTAQLLHRTNAYKSACVDVAFHPIMSNVIACCSWDGDVSVFRG